MNKRYKHLLSPLKINNTVLKNRTCFPVAPVHFLQGPETFPAEGFMTFYTNLAKNGAAYIYLDEWNNPEQRTVGAEDSIRMNYFDTKDPSVHNYLAQLADDIHFYGSKLCTSARMDWPSGYSLNGGPAMGGAPGAPPKMTEMLPTERMEEVISAYVEKIGMYKNLGYDMLSFPIMGYFSARGNTRTDEYGGGESLEERMRFPMLVLKRIKAALGKDFLIENIVAGESPGTYTAEDLADVANLFEGLIDIFVLRERDIALSHPTGFTFEPGEHKTIEYAETMKRKGVKAAIGVNGGFQDPDELEKYIAEGKCDLISMGRAFFADPHYWDKVEAGKGEDVTPCIWCNKCHGTMGAPWLTFCSVNPVMGNEHKLHRMIAEPDGKKKVAIIGGGPAGMSAAIFSAQRGHDVTLYEKSDKLGGQLLHSDYARFKWPIKRYKDWQVNQLYKLGVNVVMNCEPSPAALDEQKFDAVIAATGAKPNFPNIPGLRAQDGGLADGLWTCVDVFGKENQLGKKVVIVGGSETGVETGMYLGENGHDVTILTRQDTLAHDASKLHYITMSWVNPNAKNLFAVSPEWEKEKYGNLIGITSVTTTKVSPTSVTYVDAHGAEHTLPADSVVICGGMNPCQEEALSYTDCAPKFYMAGDCESVGNLQKCNRSAFARASRI